MAECFFLKALNQIKLNNFKESIISLDKAVALDSSVPKYYFWRGNAKEEVRLLDESLIDFNKSLKLCLPGSEFEDLVYESLDRITESIKSKFEDQFDTRQD